MLDVKVRKFKLIEGGSLRRMFKVYRDVYRVIWGECVVEVKMVGLSM